MPEYDEDACRRLVAVLLLEAIWAARSDPAEQAGLGGPAGTVRLAARAGSPGPA
jgi:hypothetical protein